MTKQIYLDNAATTPVCAPARRALEEALDEFGNPSSPHGAGTRARRMLEDARAAVAALARCSPEELLFTATGTEANNIALPFSRAAQAFGALSPPRATSLGL